MADTAKVGPATADTARANRRARRLSLKLSFNVWAIVADHSGESRAPPREEH